MPVLLRGDLRECGAGVVHPMPRLPRCALTLPFVARTLAGCLVHLAGVTLPVAELVIAATVLLLGDIIATNRELPALMLAVLFAGGGLFMGGLTASRSWVRSRRRSQSAVCREPRSISWMRKQRKNSLSALSRMVLDGSTRRNPWRPTSAFGGTVDSQI